MGERGMFGLIVAVFITMVLMAAFTFYFLLPRLACTGYDLNAITEIEKQEEMPVGSWDDMKSPIDGSRLDRIVIKENNPQLPMRTFRYVYYSSQNISFWVLDVQFDDLAWYGPFQGKPCRV